MRSLHVQADRVLVQSRRSSRRWLRVDVIAPRTPPGARGAELVVTVPAGASVASPNPYPRRTDGVRTVLELGDLVSDQVLSLVLCVELPAGERGHDATVELHTKDRGGALDASPVRVRFERALAGASAAQPRDASVARDAAHAYAARARQRAAALAREGRHDEGRGVIGRMAERLRRYAGRDRAILGVADGLVAVSARLERSSPGDLEEIERAARLALASLRADGAPSSVAQLVGERLLQGVERTADEPFSVVAVTADGPASRLADSAGRALATGSPSGFGFEVADSLVRFFDAGRGTLVPLEDESRLAAALGARTDAVKVALLRGTLEGGVPWRWHEAVGVAVVSLHGWDDADPLCRPFVAHQMALQSCRQGRPRFDPSGESHPGSVACWGDASDTRADIEARLRAGHLCDRCRRRYEEAGVDAEAFLCYVAIVRRIAGSSSDAA